MANAGVLISSAGKIRWRPVPYAAPAVAPRNRAGENTPPEAPEPRVSEVANSFKANKRARNTSGNRTLVRTSWMVA
jgi:hypothetical protein